MSGYKLNVDMWQVVNPEDQKIHRLSRGDEVPSWALPEGDDLKAVTEGVRNPLFVKDESDVPTGRSVAAEEASQARSESPQQKRDK